MILHICGSHVSNPIRESYLADTFFSQKVSDFNIISFGGDVDRKVRINKSHLVEETLRDTNNHIFYVGANSTDTSELLSGAKPNLNAKVTFPNLLHVHIDMLKVAGDDSTGTSDGDCTCFHVDINCYIKIGYENRSLQRLLLTLRSAELVVEGIDLLHLQQKGNMQIMLVAHYKFNILTTIRDIDCTGGKNSLHCQSSTEWRAGARGQISEP